MTNDQARQQFPEACAAEIDKLLAWEEEDESLTLQDIEERVLAARAAIGLTCDLG